jgi:sugar diacid utilization regulator
MHGIDTHRRPLVWPVRHILNQRDRARAKGRRSPAWLLLGLCRESHSAERFVCQILVGAYVASSIVAIAQRSATSTKNTPRVGIADTPISDVCFNDWKRFCFVLRQIARGDKNHRPLSGLEAQRQAQAALTECGYAWPGCAQRTNQSRLLPRRQVLTHRLQFNSPRVPS